MSSHSLGFDAYLFVGVMLTVLILIGRMKDRWPHFTLPRFLSRFVRASEDRYTYNHLD